MRTFTPHGTYDSSLNSVTLVSKKHHHYASWTAIQVWTVWHTRQEHTSIITSYTPHGLQRFEWGQCDAKDMYKHQLLQPSARRRRVLIADEDVSSVPTSRATATWTNVFCDAWLSALSRHCRAALSLCRSIHIALDKRAPSWHCVVLPQSRRSLWMSWSDPERRLSNG